MPLHGKIVVIKRSGGDGTEFPLTATCLFGRKPDCDIRIQLPQVSKEHCRIDLNENKEVILTNLSSVNPTRVNGEVLQQSDRLKHGDVITIIDRSFRFEYPPAPTPKKRSSTGGKVLQAQQVGDTVHVESDEKRISEVSTDPHLKDGTNHDNIQRSLEKTVEVESKEDGSLLQNKTISPFSDLYQMIKKSLDVTTPRKSSASLIQTPSSRFCTPKPSSVRKPVLSTEDKSTHKKDEVVVFSGVNEFKVPADSLTIGTQKSVKKQRKSFQVPTAEIAESTSEKGEHSAKSDTTSPPKRNRVTPQRFTACEVTEQISAQRTKSPVRRSREVTPTKPAVTGEQDQARSTSKTVSPHKASPGKLGKVEKVKEVPKKRKSGELAADLPKPQMKRKRVSFGGHLSPELFDKRLPPDSPLRKGATPRRSLCLAKPKVSLLRRASVIGSLKEFDNDGSNVLGLANMRTPSPKKSSVAKNASPKTLTPGNKSPKSKSASPAKKSPASPKSESPARKSPKSKTPSPSATSPGKKSPKSKTPSPKATSPGKKSPKSKTPSPKATSPGKKSPKSKTPSPKATSPGKKSPKSKTPPPEVNEQPKAQAKPTTPGQMTPNVKRRSSVVVSAPAHQESVTAKTPLSSIQTPTVQGRFSVSRISTPSPVVEDAVSDKVSSIAITPKIPLRRKSMKSSSRKIQSVTKSAVKVMHRRSGISRASMKVINSWADIVKFGQTKTQVTAPAKKIVTKKAIKKNVSKLQTPARKLKGHASTGHADSPVTIVVGKAYKQKIVYPTGAAPRAVTNMALFKKDIKMDEDLTGISEMFKTPANERRRRSATRTPVESLGTSVIEPSVLTTPEEPGEMIVSPLSVASTVKGRRYNSEAVQRLLNVDALENNSDCSEQQSTDLKTSPVTTPKQKPGPSECLTGLKRIMKTPRQKPEPIEDIRGRLLVTPKQTTQQQVCLTGVKRLMKTPKERVEPVEDIRGRLLVTPKQQPQQQECLTGVKRLMKTPTSLEADYLNLDGVEEVLQTPAHMQESKDLSEVADMKTPVIKNSPSACLTGIKRIMKTPKEESAPVDNRVGVKRLMRTPREKSKPVEDHFGIKRLMKSPRLRGNAPVEDFEGLQELMEESIADSTGHTEINKVEDQTQPACAVDLAKEVNIVHEEPQDDVQSHVIDDVDAAKETKVNENVNHMEEVPNGLSSGAVDEDSPVEEPKVDMVENVPEEQPEVENTTVTEINTAVADDDHAKKSLRGRRAKATESKAPEVKQETKENSNDVCPTPVRGRRLKKTETTAPLAVRQTTRNSSKDVELTMNESATQPSKIAVKPKRGRNAKKAKDEAEMQEVQEVTTERESVPEAVSEQCPPVSVDHKANDAPLEKTVTKPRRGRKTKQTEQSQSALEQENVPQANMAEDASEVYSDQLEVMPSENYENKLTEALETARAPVSQSLPEVEVTTSNEEDVAVQKKSVRGRKVKIVESKAAENEASKDPAVPAPVRGRRGTKTEATAPPNVRQRRGRNAKSVQEQAVETLVTEISAEAVSEQTSSQNTSEEENVSAPPAEEPVVKPIKGRKMKTPVEPPQLEKNEVSDQQLVTGTQQPINTVGKPRRGRKAQLDDIEPKELPEDTVANVELGRAKRVRNAKQEEEKLENDGKITSVESTKCEEPVKKLRKTRKTEQDQMEPSEDIQSVEIVQEVPDPALVSEPVKTNEQSTVAAKPRRGGRKTKQESPVESTEVQEVPAVGSTDKPKRGARGKRVIEEAEVISVPEKKPDHEFEAEQKTAAELDPVIKPSSTRRVKTEVSQTIPAKRARRGAALQLEESIAESAVLVSQSAATSVEPAKRGRRAAAKLTTGNATVSSDQANSAEELSGAVEDDKKMSKRSVKWKSDLEVFEIPKATPVKAGRGRKSKAGDQLEAEEKNVSKDANKTEEKALSDKSVEAQPVKRARRGAKIADEAESSSKVDPEKGAEAETQPKTRRGRSAKK